MVENNRSFDLSPKPVNEISTETVWRTHGAFVFSSDRIGRVDNFYPIYRYGTLFSFSILPLVMAKARLSVDRVFVDRYLSNGGDVAGPDHTVDSEIKRLGGPVRFSRQDKDRTRFVESFAAAVDADIAQACRDNPDSRHIVLCGGRDSLNILLRRWTAPVVAYSAEPNYPLVAQFVDDNRLGIEVRRLEDPEPDDGLDREVAEASCLVDLENWKWTEHLRRIVAAEAHRPVVWKGQVADALLTDYWRSYTSRRDKIYKGARKVYKRLARMAPGVMDGIFGAHVLSDVERSLWQRAAVGQGAHLGFLRSLCDCLFLSAYHGPRTAEVLRRADLPALTGGDLRIDVGRALLGRDVVYPAVNPAPPPSGFRRGHRSLDRYVTALRTLGVSVVT